MISIIIPFHNEAESLPILIKRLIEVSDKVGKDHELILVNDGSTDESISNIKYQISTHSTSSGLILSKVEGSKLHIKNQIFTFSHKKRLGKGEALNTGIKDAKGDIIVFMDADLQNDAEDLPRFIRKISEGYDFVNGVRLGRHADNFILKTYSALAEKFLKLFFHSPFTDINCGFKAFKRTILNDFVFYGNNFRFFPLAAFYNGYKVTEIEVKNNPRQFGKSKFGAGKLAAGILDTLTAFFLYKFAERPLHFFGIIGGIVFLGGFLISLYLTVERLFFGVKLSTRPLLWLGILLIIVGIQIIMTGIIGELIVYLNKAKIKKD